MGRARALDKGEKGNGGEQMGYPEGDRKEEALTGKLAGQEGGDCVT